MTGPTRPTLTGAQRKYLRGLAHSLEPLVRVGRQGLTPELLAELAKALDRHELVKVRFLDQKDEMKEICAAIDEELGAVTAGRIGHIAVIYRAARDPEDRKIRLPKAGTARSESSAR